ncbi:MAG TPA: SLBB domain-containing protein [Steroidobacteraceae bacterium]|jgi:polysaccharide export outer membrane protein|nr:SLBB domain-containing protein [Steroidobacteraceae bacterium]
MRSRFLRATAVLLSIGLASSVHTQTPEQIQALKDSLTPEQQSSLLQGVIGKGDGTGKKTDKKLNTPETVTPKNEDLTGLFDKNKKDKTADGRILRQMDEDPELRANDTVLIELTPIEIAGGRNTAVNQNNAGGNNGTAAGGVAGGANNVGGVSGTNATSGGNAGIGNGANINSPSLSEQKPKTDEEKEKSEKFRKRVLSNNPYQLNHFGVLEIPGMPAIPLAGLTASEATKRLSADPDFIDFVVKLTLLRLLPSGEQALKPFGYDLFEGVPSTFAPVSDIQVPIDYLVGPGDTLVVQLYGNEPSTYELTVQRDGRINFPKLGPIMLSGLNFDQARSLIENRVSKQLIGARVSVTMGSLRSIRVFVLGEAEKPGSYTVSGLSTMTNALFVSGGVKKIGTLRNIELKRNGRLVTTLDLYDLLLHGDTSNDRQLLPGDVIFIPPIGRTVSVDGAVRRPAIYELKMENTVAQAIDLAGGLLPDADGSLGQLERILPSRLRQMRNIDLISGDGRATIMANGDKLTIPAIRPTLENSVVLTGHVFRPGQFEYHAGLRLTDILSNFDELRPNADEHYIMIRRQVPPDEKIEVVSADLSRALAARGSVADPELRARDKIFVFDLSADRERVLEPVIRELELQATPDRPEQIVSIDGRVKAPGHYPLEPTMHVSDLIRAGGSLEDAAFRGDAELTRYEVVDGDVRRTDLIPVNLAAIRRGDSGADLPLKPYDILVIKPIPQWVEPGTIELSGEVRFPGKYPIHQGETLYSALQRAGGPTDFAFAEGAVFIREELKKRERDQLDLLANRMQSDLAALSLEAIASSAATSSSAGASSAAQGLAVGQQIMSQLRDAKPVGRLVIDLDRVMKGPSGGPEDVVLRNGDKLLVPKKTQEITILGEVQSPTSHVYEAGLTRDDYIARSGGTTQKADRRRIYVVRANGDVISGERSGWFRRSKSVEMHPGDTIVVPFDTERVRALPLWQAVTTIIYNLAVALLAVRSA